MIDPAGLEKRVLTDFHAREIARKRNFALGRIHILAMKNGIWPLRYIRNSGSFSLDDQLVLFSSRVAVIGAGGLGGHVLTLLARTGIGGLVVADPQEFEETNLNRQSFATTKSMGKNKAETAARMIEAINPAVEVYPFREALTHLNAAGILSGVRVAVDAMDNIGGRRILQAAAKQMGIPLVHGAIAGFEGQVMAVFPGESGIARIYGDGSRDPEPPYPEDLLGVPAVTPALIGTLQAMEVIKILLKRKSIFRNQMVAADLETGSTELYRFKD